MNFFKSLVTADGEVSSKRFTGLCLIGLFIICTIISACGVDINEHAFSLIKAGLYTGGGLLGIGIAPEVANTVKHTVNEKNDEIE